VIIFLKNNLLLRCGSATFVGERQATKRKRHNMRKTITLQNNRHGTSTKISAYVGRFDFVKQGDWLELTAKQVVNVKKRLCGSIDCSCCVDGTGILGPQNYDIYLSKTGAIDLFPGTGAHWIK
jgi:hypothetical protein